MINFNEKKINAFVVVWNRKAAKEYGVELNEILVIEPEAGFNGKYKVRCKCHKKKGKKTGWHYVESLATFLTKAEANSWRENNKNFEIKPCKIII